MEGRRAGEGYWSPDGKRLVFQSEREPGNPFYQIYLMDMATRRRLARLARHRQDDLLVHQSRRPATCCLPRRTTIRRRSSCRTRSSKFRASGQERRYSWDYDPEMELYVDSAKTGTLTPADEHARLRRRRRATRPTASGSCSRRRARPTTDRCPPPNRSSSKPIPSYFAEIYIMRADADGSGAAASDQRARLRRRPVLLARRQADHLAPLRRAGLIADVWTMNLDGTDQRQITDFGAMSWAPYIHPSGQYIIFASNKLGFENFELFMVDIDGKKEPVRVTYSDGFDGLPVPSPDGTQLAWTSSRGGGREGQIFLAQWNHEHALDALAARTAENRSRPRQRSRAH